MATPTSQDEAASSVDADEEETPPPPEAYNRATDEEAAVENSEEQQDGTRRASEARHEREPRSLTDSVLMAMQDSWWNTGGEVDDDYRHQVGFSQLDGSGLQNFDGQDAYDGEEQKVSSPMDGNERDSLTLPFGTEGIYGQQDFSRLDGSALLALQQDESDETLHPPVASLPSSRESEETTNTSNHGAIEEEEKQLHHSKVDEKGVRRTSKFDDESFRLPIQQEEPQRPGAEAVRGRGPGQRPAWATNSTQEQPRGALRRSLSLTETAAAFLRLNRRNDGNMDASIVTANAITDAEPVVYATAVSVDHSVRARRITIGLGILGLVVIAALVVILTISMNRPFPKQETEREKVCYRPNKEKDVFDHCFCDNNTEHFVWTSDEELEYYKQVKAALQENNVISDELEDSHQCSTQNKCLVWAANYNRLNMTKKEAYAALEKKEAITQFYIGCVFFLSMNGEDWKQNDGWLTDKYMCNWFGITCSFLARVANIKLASNGLAGHLPTELYQMAFLRELDLSRNFNITGTLPEEISQATALHMLDLSQTQLQGRLPSSLAQLEVLDRLILSNNSFTGALPENLTSRMRELYLGTNYFSGTLHSGLSKLSALESFSVAKNELSGTIPTELESWTRLEQIDLSRNNFTGSFPEFFGSFGRLTATFVVDTGLTGPIPESYCNDRHPHSRVMANCTSSLLKINCSCCTDDLVICVEDLPIPIQGLV